MRQLSPVETGAKIHQSLSDFQTNCLQKGLLEETTIVRVDLFIPEAALGPPQDRRQIVRIAKHRRRGLFHQSVKTSRPD